MACQALTLEKKNGIATITPNRPEVLNALNTRASDELGMAIEEAGKNASVRVLVITGAGLVFAPGET